MGVRHAAALALILLPPPLSADSSVETTVGRIRDYLRIWRQSLAAVVAEEHYTQTLRRYPWGRAADGETETTVRTLLSEVLLVHVPSDNAWVMFRDVLSVDGKPVQDRQRRFDDLFVRADADVVATAQRIANEGARYNLGQLVRNVNTPAAPLTFFDERYAASVRWRAAGETRLNGIDVAELTFEQKRPPFAVRSTKGSPIPVSGRVWAEPATGRIVQTEVELKVAREMGIMRMVCRFGSVAGIEPLVPIRMSEKYETGGRVHETLEAQAVYTRHRVFQTAARIVGEWR